MLNRDAPKTLGRFEIVRPLGAGAQGTVYLARDPRLGREVAIKTLHLQRGRKAPTSDPLQALLDEARIVSQLTHPNIVTLFDADDHGGTPYLVFEFVAGTPLNKRLRERGTIEPARAVDIAIQVLRAVGHAHRKGVLHRDIKPGNIMLTDDETARVMDFGIAQLIAAGAPDSEDFCGTPAYIAPEAIGERRFSPRSDVFAAGMVLYEMLTGQPAVKGQNVFEVLNRIANEPFTPPATLNGAIDERLNDIVMKSLAKDPEQRFESAQHMENALYLYLNPDNDASDPAAALGSTQGTLEFLLRRMRHKSDFPALSSTIGAVNRATASDTEAVNSLSGAILKDFALTNKLLKLVNTAYYGQFGGTISTISRAIVILGFDRVRSVAITLLLFEHLQNKQQAAKLKDDIVGSSHATWSAVPAFAMPRKPSSARCSTGSAGC
jgi:eukaryotic-like serine/threonine-protein kinase